MAKFIGEDGAGNPQSTALKEIEMQIPGAWAKLQRTERSQHSSVEMNAPDRYVTEWLLPRLLHYLFFPLFL